MDALPRAPPASWHGRLQAAGERLARQRHLLAVRDGVVGALPLVLAGSVFLLLAQPPSRVLQAWIAPWAPTLLLPTRVLGGAIALYVAFSAAYALARSYRLDAASCGLVALATYLVAAVQPGCTNSWLGTCSTQDQCRRQSPRWPRWSSAASGW